MIEFSPGLFRDAQPQSISEMMNIAHQGIKTIIDLENERGEAAWEQNYANMAGITFISVPLSAYKLPAQSDIEKILGLMADVTKRPLLVHCRHGQDRTGLLVGLYRIRFEGRNKDEAWAEMLQNGFHRLLLGLTRYFWRS